VINKLSISLELCFFVLYNDGKEMGIMNYGEKLATLRKECGYTQSYVANYLNGLSTKHYERAMVSHWEKGVALPPVEQFLLMCELYGVEDIQGTFRGKDAKYRNLPKLNSLGKNRVKEYISVLSSNPLYSETESMVMERPRRYMNRYYVSVAAGSGEFLDSNAYEEIEVDDSVPKNADYAVNVTGDSMEPRFIDGQTVYVKEQQTLEYGEIGIFSVNSHAFIKKFGRGELISINPQYEPITLNEFDSVYILGKVVG